MTYNSVLKNLSQVDSAKRQLKKMKLFAHQDNKSWDTYKMIEIINKADRNCYVLDVGCNGSPVLPMLKRLGFVNLYGCDFVLKTKYNPTFMKIVCQVYKRDYLPILAMYDDDALNLSIQNLEMTNYPDTMFDYITSLSVIEHGVNLENYFKEMSRLLKRGGYLLTSTDYWPEKLTNTKKILSQERPDNVFSRAEIENAIEIAKANGLHLIEPMNYDYQDKVISWKLTGLRYTFIFFAMRKE